jgi:RNA polymerase sigma factor (sigma-70 family)
MPTDADMLQRYVLERDERAFAELVQRHLGVVYGAALRRTGGRVHLAEEIAQKVFTDLARKAAALRHHPTLTGWLYRSTRYAAIDAARAELRREKAAQSLAAMTDPNFASDSSPEWQRLRPLLDEAMDRLKERDREALLLRYFEGLSFGEVGARLDLSENAARMRTERALDQLRGHLGRRGITSTTSVLGLLLANEAFAAAPTGLAATIASSAVAAAPAPAGVLAFFLMNKIVAPTCGAAFAAVATGLVWTFVTPGVGAEELAALRAENARLTQAAETGANAAVAGEFADQATAIVRTVEKRIEDRNAAGTGRHRDHGQATPHDAFLSYGWAMDSGDVVALAKLTTYEEKGLESVRAIHAGMPESIRSLYRTPEELMAFFFVADTLLSPVPGADVVEKFVATEQRPGHALLHRPGSTGGLNFVQTAEGWKCVVPDRYPEVLARRVLGNEMLGKLGLN